MPCAPTRTKVHMPAIAAALRRGVCRLTCSSLSPTLVPCSAWMDLTAAVCSAKFCRSQEQFTTARAGSLNDMSAKSGPKVGDAHTRSLPKQLCQVPAEPNGVDCLQSSTCGPQHCDRRSCTMPCNSRFHQQVPARHSPQSPRPCTVHSVGR